MHLRGSRNVAWALVVCGLADPAATVWGQAIGQGFELERAGRTAQAATVYLSALRADPAHLPALLGLERVLPSLGRLRELLPLAERALAADARNAALRALLLRTYVGLNEGDSAAAVAERWAAGAPGDDAPYREWALALEFHRLYADARRVLLAGRRAVGRPDALALELADLLRRVGDWEGAAREWGTAIAAQPANAPSAAAQLGETPADQRARVARVLTAPDAALPARRVGAELLLGWGEPARAWEVLAGTVAAGGQDAALALRRFADVAGAVGTPEARRARGLALVRFADLVPPQLAVRARADAARALLEAGDRDAARAVLERLVADSEAPGVAQRLAQAALVRTLVEDGQLDAAEARLAALGEALPGEERVGLRLALARARIARGELERADAALAADSGLEATALKGWVALYRGDVAQALELFRAAGPYAGERDEATARTAMLALVQQIAEPRLPQLGAALLLLARGDSAGAVPVLRRAAGQLSADGGRLDVLLVAGQIALRLGGGGGGGGGGEHDATAAELFEEIVRAGGNGAAPPAAELEWARLLVRQGRGAEAVAHLEHLILTWPGSAVVPEARRELERAKGAIPRL